MINEGDILLIEDSNKTISEVERFFSFLNLNKVFYKVAAIIYGKHELFIDQNSNKKPIDVLYEFIKNKNIPLVWDVDFSHTRPMLITELNKEITIDFKNKKIIKPAFI